jgi:uncharacterized protein YfaS (alpha-2-macroglobulin family)
VLEDGGDGVGVVDFPRRGLPRVVGQDAAAATARTGQHVVEVDVPDQAGPVDARPNGRRDVGAEAGVRARRGVLAREATLERLLDARRDGRWRTTQENAWALDSLVRYWRGQQRTAPALTARVWLGRQSLGETRFEGRAARVTEGTVPMTELRRIGDAPLVIGETGQGHLYYRVGLRYAPSNLRLRAEEQGFSVTRSYESLGAASDVRRGRDGTWHVRAGADVRVRLTVVLPADRQDVAIDDPLPAGLEAVNMAFRTTATQRISRALDEAVRDAGDFWALFAFDHREFRDDRMVAFAREAAAGVYELTYAARATTPGTFLAQPTQAEEMYAPETFGRTATDVVVVGP